MEAGAEQGVMGHRSVATVETDDHTGREVFEILAREHADMLVGFLRSLVAQADVVDDLFQETMLAACRRLGDYDRTRAFGPWLRGIATKLVLRHRARHARDVMRCDDAVLDALETRFQEAGAAPDAFRETLDRLRTCLGRLPVKLRDAIRLAYEQGLRLREVGKSMGASEEAVKKRLQRGRRLLAECLDSEGVS